VVLADESLKNQIAILNQLLEKKQGLSDDQNKLALIWKASQKRFEDWKSGIGGYDDIKAELGKLKTELSSVDDDEKYLNGLGGYLARCQEYGIGAPFSFGQMPNLVDSENLVLSFSPSGLSLPSRDYYVEDKFEEKRGMFKEHLDNIVKLVGADNLQDDFTNRVFRMEMKLAQISMSPGQGRNYDQYYTITDLAGLYDTDKLKHFSGKDENYPANKVAGDASEDTDVLTDPAFKPSTGALDAMKKIVDTMVERLQLKQVLTKNYSKHYSAGPGGDAEVFKTLAFDGDYFRRVFELITRKANRRDFIAYLQYKIIKTGSGFCTKALNEEFFDLYSRKFSGQKEQKTNEKRSVALINEWVGELLGKIYVAKHFPPEDKEYMKTMVDMIIKSLHSDLEHPGHWLTEKTRESALKKLNSFTVKIGYPDKWTNYDKLLLSEGDSLFTMQKKVNAFEHETEFLERLNSPKDKTKWEMTPQTVNAYFHPLHNEIVFPAAILQPPFFHRSLDQAQFDVAVAEGLNPDDVLLALNLGACGAVISHEISHGYDDQGRKFDHQGNMNDWWTEEDAAAFAKQEALMIKQAETYEYKDSSGKIHKMNGKLCMGENLADIGGLALAVKALVTKVGKNTELFKVFFKAWNVIYRSKETEDFAVNALTTDPHAPPSFRGNLVKNVDHFHSAFDVKEQDPMFIPKDQRVQMWGLN